MRVERAECGGPAAVGKREIADHHVDTTGAQASKRRVEPVHSLDGEAHRSALEQLAEQEHIALIILHEQNPDRHSR